METTSPAALAQADPLSKHHLRGDSPIEKSGEDLLGFSAFAKALAIGLVHQNPGSGFVVGLQARWGMGKSSAVNLCLEHVGKLCAAAKSDPIIICHFNPWFFTGNDAIRTGYLSSLTDAIEEAILQKSPPSWRRRIAEKRAAISTLWKKAPDVSDVAGNTVAGLVAFSTAGATVPISGAIQGTINRALGKKPTEADLSKKFNKLVDKLTKSPARVLIVIDDLDRLQPPELRQLLDLVKTFGNLPGVTHLLVYDRDIVDAALSDGRPDQKDRRLPGYREKIVQAEFDLPPATRSGLKKMLERETAQLNINSSAFDRMDWFYAEKLAFDVYLRSPRDVTRFANALSVSWPHIADESYFPDLFTLELWRLFERALYDDIRDNKPTIVGTESFGSNEPFQKEVLETMIGRAPSTRRPAVKSMLQMLFPRARKLLDNNAFYSTSDIRDRWRVGSDHGFDVFFRLCPPEDEFTQSERRRIEASLADQSALDAEFLQATTRSAEAGGSFLPKLLDLLIGNTDSALPTPYPLLQVILERGEEILTKADTEPQMRVSGRDYIEQITRRCLFQIPDDSRAAAFESAIAGAGWSTQALVLAKQFRPHDLKLSDEDRQRMADSALSSEDAHRLTEDFIRKVETDPQRILTAPVEWPILDLWSSVKGSTPVRDWITENVHDPRLVVLLIDLVMIRDTSHRGPHRRLQNPIHWDFIDIYQLLNSARALKLSNIIPIGQMDLVDTFIGDAEQYFSNLSDLLQASRPISR